MPKSVTKTTNILFTITLMLLSVAVKGQDQTIGILAVMNNNINMMQTVLSDIEQSIKRDRHKEMDTQIHQLDNAVSEFETSNAKLPSEYALGITEKTDQVRSSADAFEKIAHKSKVFDKDKELKDHFAALQINVNDLQEYFAGSKSAIEANIGQARNRQHEGMQKPGKITPPLSSDARDAALKEIERSNAEIKIQFEKITEALKASKYADVAEHAKKVSALSDKMLLLLNDLTEKERTALNATVTSSKKEAESLRVSALKGASDHDDIHKHFEKLKAQVNTLDAQMALLK